MLAPKSREIKRLTIASLECVNAPTSRAVPIVDRCARVAAGLWQERLLLTPRYCALELECGACGWPQVGLRLDSNIACAPLLVSGSAPHRLRRAARFTADCAAIFASGQRDGRFFTVG